MTALTGERTAATVARRHLPLAFALFALGFALVFRGWLFTGFDGAFGDEEDGYLALAIIEHWRHVFAGTVHWTDPIVFFPARGTLGYTDAFFLVGAADAALRGLGLDAFTAFMVVMAAVSAIGFFGFRRLAIRHFGVPPAFAAIGAFLFAFGNLDAVKLIHVQVYCAMLLPVLCDLALSAWKQARGAAMLAALAGAFYALMFLTAFQASWFFAFYLLLMALLCPVVFGRQGTLALLHEICARRTIVLAGAAGFAAGIVPFLLLYVPVFLSGHSRGFAEVAGNMPQWRDLLNVTAENGVWGPLFERLGIAGRPDRPVWEVELAFTPVALAVFSGGLIITALRVARASSSGATPSLPLPARGERVGVRGRFHESEPPKITAEARTRGEAPSPGSWSLSSGRPKAGPVGAPTSPRTRGEVGSAALGEGAMGSNALESDRLLLLMGLSVVAVWLLQMDYFGIRPWRAVWAVVPGAKAIRYTFRSQLVANLFVSLIVARTLAGLARHRIAVIALAAVLIAEQVNLVWPPTMSRKAALAWIDAAPAPPAGCRAFYVVPNAGPPERSGPQHQDDAMLFAQIRGIPTLNGYSSWFPDGWALDEPGSPGYPAAVRAWAEKNHLRGEVCGLEPRTGRWMEGLPGQG
jgi:hypothetical protein